MTHTSCPSGGSCMFSPPCATPGATHPTACGDRKPPATPPDMINPAHYKAGTIEVIDFIREQLGDAGFVAYCRGNAIKYMSRAGKKADASPQDAAKAGWYGQMAAHVGEPSKYTDPRR